MSSTIKQPQNFMMYTDKPYTNILKGSLSDAKLKYLNIRDYFKNEGRTNKYYMPIYGF